MVDRLEATIEGFRVGIYEMEQSPSFLMLGDARPGTQTATDYASAIKELPTIWAFVSAVEERLRHVRNEGGSPNLLVEPLAAALPSGLSAPLSVEQMLGEIRDRYDAIHVGVAKIDQAWLHVLPSVEAATKTLTRLSAEADQLGVVEPLIGRAQARAEVLGELLMSDPVGVTPSDGNELDSLVADAARQMTSLRSGRDNLASDLAATEELLASLRVLRTRAAAAEVESRRKIVDPGNLVTVPSSAVLDGSGGLGAQLDELLAQSESQKGAAWTHRRSTLDRWLTTAKRLEAQFLSAMESNGRPLRERDELRGRLQAFQAKMAAMGKAEDEQLAELADQAWVELHTAPSDLPQAAAAIEALANKLRSKPATLDEPKPGVS